MGSIFAASRGTSRLSEGPRGHLRTLRETLFPSGTGQGERQLRSTEKKIVLNTVKLASPKLSESECFRAPSLPLFLTLCSSFPPRPRKGLPEPLLVGAPPAHLFSPARSPERLCQVAPRSCPLSTKSSESEHQREGGGKELKRAGKRHRGRSREGRGRWGWGFAP